MEKNFELKNINKKDIFVGDIYIIEKVFDNLIDNIKNTVGDINDLSTICYRTLAKKDAILIKINQNNYIDMDFILNKNIDNMEDYLNRNFINSNLIMTAGTLDPYVGQLYVERFTLKNIKEPKKVLKKLRDTQR